MVRERQTSSYSFPYSERHVQCAWFDSAFRPSKLLSASGEAVAVEDPGRWNLEAGPDFLDAVLTIGPEHRRVCGDVEVHIHPEDWLRHGHSKDPAYSRLIAHVSYFPGTIETHLLPPTAIQISLKDALKTDPLFSFDSIDTTAYPYLILPDTTPPCASILSSWNPDEKAMLLNSAGEERLRIKALRMTVSIEERGADQILYEEIMAALGYKHNVTAFRQLAATLPLNTLRDESGQDVLKAYSLLLGVSGLIPSRTSSRWDNPTRVFVRELWNHWWKQQSRWESRLMATAAWKLAGLRPQNNPVRRLAAAASMFVPTQDFNTLLRKMVNISPESSQDKMNSMFQPPQSLAYWNRHLSFSGKEHVSDVALVGVDRIAAIQSNVIIPFAAANGTPVEHLLKQLCPEQDNTLVRAAAFALFGRDHNSVLYRNGLRQQGLIQIFHDFCLNNRSACRDCALPAALRDFRH